MEICEFSSMEDFLRDKKVISHTRTSLFLLWNTPGCLKLFGYTEYFHWCVYEIEILISFLDLVFISMQNRELNQYPEKDVVLQIIQIYLWNWTRCGNKLAIRGFYEKFLPLKLYRWLWFSNFIGLSPKFKRVWLVLKFYWLVGRPSKRNYTQEQGIFLTWRGQ